MIEEPQTAESQTMTTINTSEGVINVLHDITLGDLLVSSSLFLILIFLLLSKFVGGDR